jgi:hypothetical protein
VFIKSGAVRGKSGAVLNFEVGERGGRGHFEGLNPKDVICE